MNRLLSLAAVALTAVLATGCGGRTGAGQTQVGFVSNNTAQFWTIAEAGTKKAEQEFGVKVLFRRPPNATAADQKEIIDTLLTQGVQAIAVSVIDPTNQKAFLDRIAEKAPLITQDNDCPDSKRLCYIGTDNLEAGKAVGELIKKVMPDGGTVAIFVGQFEPLNAQQRRQGVLNALAGEMNAKGGTDGKTYGKYKLHGNGPANGPFTDNLDEKVAKGNADDVLVQLKDEKNLCLVGLWAYNPPAIYKAVTAAGKEGKVHIVGFDEDENTLLGIKKGHIHGTVVQQPFEFGYQAVKMMAALAKGDRSVLPKDGVLHVPHRVITQENVEAFHSELNKMLGK